MSNSELIERAAKAIKLPECGWMGPAFMYVKDNTFTDWNPLESISDAMMLAFALYMKLQITPHGAAASTGDTFRLVALDEANDIQSALCLAITKLAATRV